MMTLFVHDRMAAPDRATRPAAIMATGLRKAYGDHAVLDGIDLRVPAAMVFALLGPNGAGETTMVEILSTLIGADGERRRSPAMTCAANLAPYGPQSESPGSSRRWTNCWPARRTSP